MAARRARRSPQRDAKKNLSFWGLIFKYRKDFKSRRGFETRGKKGRTLAFRSLPEAFRRLPEIFFPPLI
jgi:hypothetical protein